MLKKIVYSFLALGLAACAGDDSQVEDPMAGGAIGGSSAASSTGPSGVGGAMSGQQGIQNGNLPDQVDQNVAIAGQSGAQHQGQAGKLRTYKLQEHVMSLNIRSGPGTKYPVIGMILKGYTAQEFGKKSFWLKISDSKDQWVSGRYVDLVSEQSSAQSNVMSGSIPCNEDTMEKIQGFAYNCNTPAASALLQWCPMFNDLANQAAIDGGCI